MKKKTVVLLASLLITTGLASAISFDSIFQPTGTAAVIQLSGNIMPSASGLSTGITPDQVRDLNDRARQNNVDAVVYEINSGGGAVVASKEVMRSIDSVEVPTVCRFRDTGASGAYLAALGCDRIVADSATLTGSIGVRSSYIQYSGLMDRLGLKYVNITAGENKELGSPYQNISESEKDRLKQKADTIHEEFLEKVEDERDLSDSQLENVSTGEAFLGSKAEELGLVDEIGGRETAYDVAENLTDMELNFREVEKPQSFDLFSFFSSSIGGLDGNEASFNSRID